MKTTFNTHSTPVYDSAKRSKPALNEIVETIRYKNLLVQLIRRNVVARYKRSVLGVAWTMLNPLGIMLVMTIVFSNVFGRGDATYPAYVLSGLLAWQFFSETTNTSIRQLIWGSDMLKRIYIPPTTFAVSAIGTSAVNLFFSLVPLVLVMLVIGAPIRWTIIFIPIPMLFLAMFSLGASLIISGIAVYFADAVEMYQVILRAWMYLTPIIYKETIFPEAYRFWATRMNPLYHLVELFRVPIYYGQVPSWDSILVTGAIATTTLLVGWIFFTRRSHEFAYRI